MMRRKDALHALGLETFKQWERDHQEEGRRVLQLMYAELLRLDSPCLSWSYVQEWLKDEGVELTSEHDPDAPDPIENDDDSDR